MPPRSILSFQHSHSEIGIALELGAEVPMLLIGVKNRISASLLKVENISLKSEYRTSNTSKTSVYCWTSMRLNKKTIFCLHPLFSKHVFPFDTEDTMHLHGELSFELSQSSNLLFISLEVTLPP